jgi:hypothetical protein
MSGNRSMDKISADQRSVDQKSVDQKSVDQRSLTQSTRRSSHDTHSFSLTDATSAASLDALSGAWSNASEASCRSTSSCAVRRYCQVTVIFQRQELDIKVVLGTRYLEIIRSVLRFFGVPDADRAASHFELFSQRQWLNPDHRLNDVPASESDGSQETTQARPDTLGGSDASASDASASDASASDAGSASCVPCHRVFVLLPKGIRVTTQTRVDVIPRPRPRWDNRWLLVVFILIVLVVLFAKA